MPSPAAPSDPDDTPGSEDVDQSRSRIVPESDCRTCSDNPDAPGLCISCFLA